MIDDFNRRNADHAAEVLNHRSKPVLILDTKHYLDESFTLKTIHYTETGKRYDLVEGYYGNIKTALIGYMHLLIQEGISNGSVSGIRELVQKIEAVEDHIMAL